MSFPSSDAADVVPPLVGRVTTGVIPAAGGGTTVDTGVIHPAYIRITSDVNFFIIFAKRAEDLTAVSPDASNAFPVLAASPVDYRVGPSYRFFKIAGSPDEGNFWFHVSSPGE